MAKIYLATSWKNNQQPILVELLRTYGHEVYDFRNPNNTTKGFQWEFVDPNWKNWSAKDYIEGLQTPAAQIGFNLDFNAMKWADVGLLLLPCGRSAHLELGWMAGAGKKTIILTNDNEEPELMALLADKIFCKVSEVLNYLK